MRKFILIPAILSLLFACNSSSSHKTLADSLQVADTSLKHLSPNQIIVPGKSIGNMIINGNADSLAHLLGKPNFSDASMGAVYMSWNIKRKKAVRQVNIYAKHSAGAADEAISHIEIIRVTSPWYKTADYAGPGSMLKDIIKLYKLKRHPSTGAKKLWVYDDYNAGIAFEVDSTQRCVSVLVHTKGDSTLTYINMHQ
jgi:hypothetical protein